MKKRGNVVEEVSNKKKKMTEHEELEKKRESLGCRSVDLYEKLNMIDEGAYGVVFRARDKETGEIVALKKLKIIQENRAGFPLTSLREIKLLQSLQHPHIVHVKEVAVSKKKLDFFIAMEFVEHDLKDLMADMKDPFSPSEVKCLLSQLLSAVEFLHSNWIIHRDLKTSNLLYNNKGELKVADFGLARQFGEPAKDYSPLVVTLWYRAPELLFGMTQYSTAVDVWSVGCIFAEFMTNKVLMQGNGEIDQTSKIFKLLGTPNEKIWPGFSDLPYIKNLKLKSQPYSNLRNQFPNITDKNFDLLNRMLTYDPNRRISAANAALHKYFQENPRAKDVALMPSWPSGNEGKPRRAENRQDSDKWRYQPSVFATSDQPIDYSQYL